MTEWVKRIDPKASDELLILARGRCVAGAALPRTVLGIPCRLQNSSTSRSGNAQQRQRKGS
jgi:hypothetical protein